MWIDPGIQTKKKISDKDVSSITSRDKYLNRNTCTHLHVLFQYALTRTVCQGKRGRIIYCAVTTYDIERPLFTVSVRTMYIHRLAFETSLSSPGRVCRARPRRDRT